MSKIIKESGYRKLSHIVKCDDIYYLVDSNDTFDRGYETMAFLYDIKKDEVISWLESYVKWYKTEEEMEKYHFEICENLERYLKEYNE